MLKWTVETPFTFLFGEINMKKICAIILVFSTLFLCACTSGDTEKTTTSAPTSAVDKTIITEWGTDLLPEDFPAPPNGTYNFEIAQGNHETDVSDYAADWVRIRFTCPTNALYEFTNAFLNSNYKGGSKNVTEGIDYYRTGLHGYWCDGEKIIKINSSNTAFIQETMASETTVIIDIVPVKKGIPEVLLQYFPDFDGYCVGNGIYCGHDASLEFISSDYSAGLSPNWHWEFLGTGSYGNCFVNVSQDDFDDYCDLLGEAKFSGPISTGIVDGFNVTMVDVTKDIDNTTYGVYIIYNHSLLTLDIAFTNNPKLITGEH